MSVSTQLPCVVETEEDKAPRCLSQAMTSLRVSGKAQKPVPLIGVHHVWKGATANVSAREDVL